MSNKDEFWYDQLKNYGLRDGLRRLFSESKRLEVVPMNSMSKEQKLNALVRGSIYAAVALIVIKRRGEFVWIIVFALIISIILKEEDAQAVPIQEVIEVVKVAPVKNTQDIVEDILKVQGETEKPKPMSYNSRNVGLKLGKPGDSTRQYRKFEEGLKRAMNDVDTCYKTPDQKFGEDVEHLQNTYINIKLKNDFSNCDAEPTKTGFENTKGISRWAAPQWDKLYDKPLDRDLKKYIRSYA